MGGLRPHAGEDPGLDVPTTVKEGGIAGGLGPELAPAFRIGIVAVHAAAAGIGKRHPVLAHRASVITGLDHAVRDELGWSCLWINVPLADPEIELTMFGR